MRDISEAKCLHYTPRYVAEEGQEQMVKAREGIIAKHWLCHVYCRGWKAAQGPQESPMEEGALCVKHHGCFNPGSGHFVPN